MEPDEIAKLDEFLLNGGGEVNYRELFKEKIDGVKDNDIIYMIIAEFITYHHYYGWLGDKEGEFVKWINGVWHKNVHVAIGRLIRKYLRIAGIKMSGVSKGDIMERIREEAQLLAYQMNRDTRYINFKNGLLDLETWELQPHDDTEKRAYTIQIPWDYQENREAPSKFLDFLYKAFEGDMKQLDLIMKAIGYSLTFEVKFQKIIILKDGPEVGKEGKTGKSTLLEVVHSLIGEDNCTSIELQRLARRFGTMGLTGKLYNYYPDISTNKAIGDPGKIKILIDKMIPYEVKGGGFFEMVNIVKHWFSTQSMPPVIGLDLAYCRRFIIVIFNRRIPEDELVLDFSETIITDEEEMKNIISMCVDAYRELVEDNGFSSAQDEYEVMDIIMGETDSVYRFLKERCDTGGQYEDIQEKVYEAYAEFAKSDGCLDVLKKPQFTADLYSKGFGKGRVNIKNAEGKRPYTYTGLKLKETQATTPKIKVKLTQDVLNLDLGISLEDECKKEILGEDFEDEKDQEMEDTW